jgi:hypothetical protein
MRQPPPSETSCTTTLRDLRGVTFGLAAGDERSAADVVSGAAPEEDGSDRGVRVALQICVRLPPETLPEEGGGGEDRRGYRDRQVRALLTYHLRRYAAALNASLVFVRHYGGASDDDDTTLSLGEEERRGTQEQQEQQQPSVPVHHLPVIWRDLALGKPVWKGEVDGGVAELVLPGRASAGSDDGNEVGEEESGYSLIYGPGNHNEELIETVLLRSAHYPGHWDASQHSVWKILQTDENRKTASSNTKKAVEVGDEAWLAQLRDSVASDRTVTPPRKAKTTPNDAAVSSFFEDLLKK